MGFGSAPKPVDPAKVAPPPPTPSPWSAVSGAGAGQAGAASRAAGAGMAGTILTDPEGILSHQDTAKNQLLGS